MIINLTDRRADASRQRQLDILGELGPDGIERQLAKLQGGSVVDAGPRTQPVLPHLVMPAHHDVRPEDIVARRLHGNLAAAAECGPQDFVELLLVPGVGPRTVRALAPGRGSRARRALPLQRPGAVFCRPRWQGSASVSGAAEGIRSHHRRAEDCSEEGPVGPVRRAGGDRAPGQTGPPVGTACKRAFGRGAVRGRERPLARIWRPERIWLRSAFRADRTCRADRTKSPAVSLFWESSAPLTAGCLRDPRSPSGQPRIGVPWQSPLRCGMIHGQ
jgi:hypothetical protein